MKSVKFQAFLIILILSTSGLYAAMSCSGQTPHPANTESLQASSILPEIEAATFEGVDLTPIKNQGNNAVAGTQYLDRDTYELRVYGLVDNEKRLTYDEILELPAVSEAVYMPCVEGWGFMAKWTGVKVLDVLDLAGLKDGATYVIFHCAGDDYSTGLPLDYLRDNEIIIAYGLNDLTLPADRGFPFQLVAKVKYGYKWAKWITGIEVTDHEVAGYWEQRGYSNSANVDEPGYTGRVGG
jgi:DMSO/TMAO reductase YedYZ molybdopterin-dependent catalytic subunit